jgi:hypothetical protein
MSTQAKKKSKQRRHHATGALKGYMWCLRPIWFLVLSRWRCRLICTAIVMGRDVVFADLGIPAGQDTVTMKGARSIAMALSFRHHDQWKKGHPEINQTSRECCGKCEAKTLSTIPNLALREKPSKQRTFLRSSNWKAVTKRWKQKGRIPKQLGAHRSGNKGQRGLPICACWWHGTPSFHNKESLSDASRARKQRNDQRIATHNFNICKT